MGCAATVALFALTAIAYAGDDIMASRYGNTTIATDSKGVQTKLYYAADGTFTGKQGSLAFKGTWKVADGKVCLTFTPSVPNYTNPFCPPVTAHNVGDTWSAGGSTVTLVKGIQ
jgi:hypothetical protein